MVGIQGKILEHLRINGTLDYWIEEPETDIDDVVMIEGTLENLEDILDKRLKSFCKVSYDVRGKTDNEFIVLKMSNLREEAYHLGCAGVYGLRHWSDTNAVANGYGEVYYECTHYVSGIGVKVIPGRRPKGAIVNLDPKTLKLLETLKCGWEVNSLDQVIFKLCNCASDEEISDDRCSRNIGDIAETIKESMVEKDG